MSYNPKRASGNSKRRRQPNPHAGIKHSDIVRRSGVGVSAPALTQRDDTRHGFSSDVFSCPSFDVRYETVYAGNNTGLGVSNDGDRTIRVLNGSLFVLYENQQGVQVQERIGTGMHFHAPRGVKHAFATSGTEDVELLFIETPQYGETWEALGESTVRIDMEAVVSAPDAAMPMRRTDATQAYAQAERAARAKSRRRPAKTKVVSPQNANSGNITGVNPKPMGPQAFEE